MASLHVSKGLAVQLGRMVGVAGFAASLLSCAPIQEDRDSIYYRSQSAADADLARFEADNPDCQLWTNWQKLCSRTGEDGAVSCSATSQFDEIRPSTPFCAAIEDGGAYRPIVGDGIDEIRSSLRFCDYPAGKPDSIALQIDSCVYSPARPFSGRSLADRQHSWCKTWYEAGEVRKASSTRLAPHGLYCAERDVPEWCEYPDGFGFGPSLEMIERARKGIDQEATIGILVNPDAMPVRGVFCRRRSR